MASNSRPGPAQRATPAQPGGQAPQTSATPSVPAAALSAPAGTGARTVLPQATAGASLTPNPASTSTTARASASAPHVTHPTQTTPAPPSVGTPHVPPQAIQAAIPPAVPANPIAIPAQPPPAPTPTTTPTPANPHPHHSPQLPQIGGMNNPTSPRRIPAGRFTPSGIVDQAHESEWAGRIARMDWDETSIVFTKRQLVDFLRYLGVHVDPNTCEDIAGLPRYAIFGKISSAPAPVLPGSMTPAHSGPPTPTTSSPQVDTILPTGPTGGAAIPVGIPLAGGFRPTHRARTSRSSLSGSPQTTGLFGPGEDGPELAASPPGADRVMREAVRPSPPAPSYPPPDTAAPESSDEEPPPPHLTRSHSPLSTPPATPSRQGTYRARQSSGGAGSSIAVMFPIENVQHTTTGYPVAPSSSTGSTSASRASPARDGRDTYSHSHTHAHSHASGSGMSSGGGAAARGSARPPSYGRH